MARPMTGRWLSIEEGEGPIVATAIHDGHLLRDDVAALTALTDAERLREEDPFTAEWTAVAGTRLVPSASRFEVDLNRPRDGAVYMEPGDAWGLQLWRNRPPGPMVEASLARYDEFYAELDRVLGALRERFDGFVVLDLHSYNHRRGGPGAPPDDPELNPQINVGTGSMDRRLWGPLAERFMADLAAYDFPGGRLDVRENVKFSGGHMSRWIHERYPDSGCCLAIEHKKFFMDEWTGEPDESVIAAIAGALGATVPGLIESLSEMGAR